MIYHLQGILFIKYFFLFDHLFFHTIRNILSCCCLLMIFSSDIICIFLCTETASTVSFSLCCSQVERECGVQPLFCFSSDLEGSEWEKNSLRSRKGQEFFFCQGKEKFSGQVQGWLTCTQLVNFVPFCICLVCESFRYIFWQGKESNKQGVLPREIKFLLKAKLDSFPNFEHLTEEGRPVGGGRGGGGSDPVSHLL